MDLSQCFYRVFKHFDWGLLICLKLHPRAKIEYISNNEQEINDYNFFTNRFQLFAATP